MNSKDKLQEALINILQNKLQESYFQVLATNRGMYGGMTTPLRLNGKVMLFKDKSTASEYIYSKNNNKINNFNSYTLDEVDIDDEYLDNYFIVNSLEDIEKELQNIADIKNQVEKAIEAERDKVYKELTDKISQYEKDFIKLEKSLHCDILIRMYKKGDNYEYTNKKISVIEASDYDNVYRYQDIKLTDINEVINRALKDIENTYKKIYK